jgi:hypothetical protein
MSCGQPREWYPGRGAYPHLRGRHGSLRGSRRSACWRESDGQKTPRRAPDERPHFFRGVPRTARAERPPPLRFKRRMAKPRGRDHQPGAGNRSREREGETFSLTGWKVGYVTAAPALLDPVTKAHQFTTFTTPPNFQKAVAYGLAMDDAYYAALCQASLRRSAIVSPPVLSASASPSRRARAPTSSPPMSRRSASTPTMPRSASA